MKKWIIMLSFIVLLLSLLATLDRFELSTNSGRSSEIRSNFPVAKDDLIKKNEWQLNVNTSEDPMILEPTSVALDLFRNRSEADLKLLSMAERLHLNLAIIYNFLQVSRRNSLSKNQQISLARELSKGDLRLEVELINWVRNNGTQPGPNVLKKSIPVDGGPIFENIRRIEDHP